MKNIIKKDEPELRGVPRNRAFQAPNKEQVENIVKLSEFLGVPFYEDLGEVQPPDKLIIGEFNRVLGSWAKSIKAVPVMLDDDNIAVAICEIEALDFIDAFRLVYDRPVKLVFSTESEILRVINSVRTSLMNARTSELEKDENDKEVNASLKIDVTDAEDDDAPIIRYVNALIFRAASERASDIHIEPFEEELKVRFRVDGVLRDVDTESKKYQPAILSRIKVMADLNIAEKRLPQDGRIGLKVAGRDVDIRVSTVPTRYGERIVLRLLDKGKVMLSLTSLGLDREIKEQIEKIIKKSHGIFLVTGPTGSGKSTTLYASLASINSEDKNILTVEDPIEYELKGVGQMQVSPKIDFTFANGLRSILRQDPDIIMVGEIRDLETAEIAIQASLTGHLVFSTLHTNDAPGAITRLMDMGVEPFLISSSLLGAMAQRLVRRVCPLCRIEGVLKKAECEELGLDSKFINQRIYRASDSGCKNCQNTGYTGRCGIHEMLHIDDKVRAQIMLRSDASKIRQSATGLQSLRYDGGLKIMDGITTVEEVLRVTQEDNLIF